MQGEGVGGCNADRILEEGYPQRGTLVLGLSITSLAAIDGSLVDLSLSIYAPRP